MSSFCFTLNCLAWIRLYWLFLSHSIAFVALQCFCCCCENSWPSAMRDRNTNIYRHAGYRALIWTFLLVLFCFSLSQSLLSFLYTPITFSIQRVLVNKNKNACRRIVYYIWLILCAIVNPRQIKTIRDRTNVCAAHFHTVAISKQRELKMSVIKTDATSNKSKLSEKDSKQITENL